MSHNWKLSNCWKLYHPPPLLRWRQNPDTDICGDYLNKVLVRYGLQLNCSLHEDVPFTRELHLKNLQNSSGLHLEKSLGHLFEVFGSILES